MHSLWLHQSWKDRQNVAILLDHKDMGETIPSPFGPSPLLFYSLLWQKTERKRVLIYRPFLMLFLIVMDFKAWKHVSNNTLSCSWLWLESWGRLGPIPIFLICVMYIQVLTSLFRINKNSLKNTLEPVASGDVVLLFFTLIDTNRSCFRIIPSCIITIPWFLI